MRAAIAAAIALALAPAAAHAGVLLDALKATCVKADNSPTGVLLAADELGWMPVPAALLKDIAKGDMAGAQARMRTDENGLYFLLVGKGEQKVKKRTLTLHFCAVGMAPPPARAELQAEVAEWTGVARSRDLSDRKSDGYAWFEENGAKTVVEDPDDEAAEKLITEGRIKMVLLTTDRDVALLVYARPQL